MNTEYHNPVALAVPAGFPVRRPEPVDHTGDTVCFSRLGFRIQARPGRQPRFIHRGPRGRRAGRCLQAINCNQLIEDYEECGDRH
jgi:hypothetical protein